MRRPSCCPVCGAALAFDQAERVMTWRRSGFTVLAALSCWSCRTELSATFVFVAGDRLASWSVSAVGG